jgi:hypothetical protein
MSIRLFNGLWLVVGGNLATSDDCCCLPPCSGPCDEENPCPEGCVCCTRQAEAGPPTVQVVECQTPRLLGCINCVDCPTVDSDLGALETEVGPSGPFQDFFEALAELGNDCSGFLYICGPDTICCGNDPDCCTHEYGFYVIQCCP